MSFLGNLFGHGKKKEFGRLLVDILLQFGELTEEEIKFDEKNVSLTLTDILGKRHLNLDDYYQKYARAADSEKKSTLQDMADSLIRTRRGIPRNYDICKKNILPYIRQRVYFQVRPLNLQLSQKTVIGMPHAALSDHLAVEVVYNMEEKGIRTIDQEHLDGWGLSFDQVLSQAVSNFREQSERRWSVPEARVYVSPWHGKFDASAILFPDIIQNFRVIGDHIIMVPIHNTLIVTGSNDHLGLEKMAELAENIIRENSYFLSTIPMILKDNELQTYWLPRQHRLYRRFKVLIVESLMRDYTAQKEALENHYAQSNTNISVADYTAVDNGNTGQCNSYCVWLNHSPPILLPETDQIYFVTDPETGTVDFMADFKKVLEALGDLVQPMGMTPERYRVTGYPNAAQFKEFAD